MNLELDHSQQRWEAITIKYDPIENKKAIFFSIYACLIPLPLNEILIFGGDINFIRDDYQENCLQQDECQNLRILNTDTLTVRILRHPNGQPIKFQHTDFFYFNQSVRYKDRFYAMGKEHMHIVSQDYTEIKCLQGEGD